MSDTAPFSPFSPSPPPKPMFEGEVAAPAKKRGNRAKKAQGKRQKREPRAATASGTAFAAPTVEKVPTRKRARKPRPTMIPISNALSALGGLNQDEANALMALVIDVNEMPKKSRHKIVAALGKVFA